MLNNPQTTFTEEEVLNFYKENYKTKICSEIRFEDTLPELFLKQYEKFKRSSCCIRPLSLLIYSIIVLIIACAGFYFAISENKGYKAYKGVLERNMSAIDNTFPHEHETIRLVKYLTTPNENDILSCPYIRNSLGLCTEASYSSYCTNAKYSENKCNYMDYQYYLGNSFTCDLSNYKNGRCDQVQYIDNLEAQGKTYVPKIEFTSIAKIKLRSFAIEKLFCKIGDYDRPIYLSFIIILFVFIILLIFDLAVKKKTLTSGVKYYIIVTFYMIYYVLLRIYAILFFILLYYGVLVCFLHPTTADKSEDTGGIGDDPFLYKEAKIYFPEDKTWKDERIYALVFCGICLVLFIMVLILCSYKRLLYNYLSFNFEDKNETNIDANIAEDNNITKLRNASIKVGKISCDFEIKQNKELFLEEKRSKKKFSFKEVLYQNETYFLKCNNLGLKDQLAWNEFKFQYSNEIFFKLSKMLHLILAISFFILSLYIMEIKNDVTYDYFIHLIDLGYKPKKYKYVQKSQDLNDSFYNYILYIYLILGIFIMICLGKIAYFGGFKNMIFIWISILISVVIALLNLASIILSIVGFIYTILSFTNFPGDKIDFKESINKYFRYMLLIYFYPFTFMFSFGLFIYSLTLISPLNRIKRENDKLPIENKTSEDMFKYISFENKFWSLEVVNNNNDLPKHLFYIKKICPNPFVLPPLQKSDNKIICLQMNNEEILDDKEKALLLFYKHKDFNTKRIISRIISQIIYSGISIILLIVLLCLSCNRNDYYKAYKDFLLEYDKYISNAGLDSILPTYINFWCDFGDLEDGILISLFIFIIIYLGFEILSLLIHKIVIKIDFNNGIFAKIILFANMIFFVLFKIYLPLLFYLIVCTFVICIYSPHNATNKPIFGNSANLESALNDEWNKKRYFLIASFILKFIFITFFSFLIKVKYHIIEYINKLYEESEDEEEQENNKINAEKNEVTTSININNINYGTRVKLNDILYLQEIFGEFLGKKFKFKKIYIQGITPDFIYVRLGQNAIADRISNAHWNYPDINYIFSKLGDMCDWIYMILFFSVPLFKLHVKNELAYSLIKVIHKGYENRNLDKPLFADIFDMYGSFEKGLTESRFALYIVQLVFIFALMLKRIHFGGFNKSSNLLVVFVINIIFLVQNIIYVIFDFLLILFSIFCVVCYYKNKYDLMAEDTMDAKFFLQIILNADMFVNNLRLLKENAILTKYLNTLRKAMDKFIKREDNIDEDDPNFKPVEFKFVSLDGNICSLKEFNNGMLQRYLFYNLDGAENNKKIEIVTNELNTNGENKIKLQEVNEIVIHQNKNTNGQTVPNSETFGIKENIDENNIETDKKLK